MNRLALAPLTVLPAPPIAQIEAAARAGFDAVGLRLNPVLDSDPRIVGDAVLCKMIAHALRDHALRVLDIEVFRVEPHTDVRAMEAAIALGAEFGARHMLCTSGAGDPWAAGEEAATAAKFAELAELAGRYRVRPVLEFMVFRKMATLADAQRMHALAGHPNLGICVDALHLARSGGTAADVNAVPPALLPYVQLCDAPRVATLPAAEEARFDRLYPGEGGLPLIELLAALPDGITLSLEAPSRRHAALDASARAVAIADATRALVGRR